MHIVIVNICVLPGDVEEFIERTKHNVAQSNQEPGVVTFQFLRVVSEPDKFIIYEVYKTPDDQQRHRETPHYQTWKKAVEPMMAVPRVGTICQPIN